MNNPISPFEKWRLETIPQVGFTPEIRELLAMAFEGGRQSVKQEWQSLSDDEVREIRVKYAGLPWNEGFWRFYNDVEQALKEKNHESIYK